MITSGEKNDILYFVKEVLSNRFAGEKLKQDINPGTKSLNFACPYCGDSKVDPKNYRGNLYLKTKTYKCWNDGCYKFTTMREFISHWSQEYDIDIAELEIDFDAEFNPYESEIKLDGNSISEYLKKNGLLNQLIDIDSFAERFRLRNITLSAPGTKAYEFYTSRNLDKIPDVADYIFFDDFDSGVYIFNYDKMSRKVLSFSIRTLNKDKIKKKYDIFTYSRIVEKLNIKDPIKNIELIDTFGNYFNIMNVDFKKPITILEGQIDSMFIENSIASTGLSKFFFLLEFVDKNMVKLLFDNDKAGKTTALEMITEGYNTFLWSVLINKLERKFNLDYKKLKKIKDINNLYSYLNEKASVGLDKFNTLLNRYYSNSPYDMLFI